MPLKKILNREFFHHFQPIYDILNFNIIGYEGLFRTKDLINPEVIFTLAKKENKLYELDTLSIHKALFSFKNSGYPLEYEYLFLNVFPSSLSNPSFYTLIHEMMDEVGIPSGQIVFEINENDLVDIETLKKVIRPLKELGFKIAIDDFGKGSATFIAVIELNPDFIKLDRYFVENLHHSLQKKDVINYILQFSKKFNSRLIVEGVEDSSSLDFLKKMGIEFAQGYLLGKPAALPEVTIAGEKKIH